MYTNDSGQECFNGITGEGHVNPDWRSAVMRVNSYFLEGDMSNLSPSDRY